MPTESGSISPDRILWPDPPLGACGSFAAVAAPVSMRTAAADDIDGRSGVALAIATICVDGFGDENFKYAFELLPQLGYKNVEFNVWHPRDVTPSGIQGIQERCFENGLKPISLQGSSFGGHAVKDVAHKLWLMEQATYLGGSAASTTW